MISAERVRSARLAIRAIDAAAVEDVIYLEHERREARRLEAELRRGRPRAVNCFSCGCWKARPSSVCGQCGDDPVTHNGSAQDFDTAYYGEVVV